MTSLETFITPLDPSFDECWATTLNGAVYLSPFLGCDLSIAYENMLLRGKCIMIYIVYVIGNFTYSSGSDYILRTNITCLGSPEAGPCLTHVTAVFLLHIHVYTHMVTCQIAKTVLVVVWFFRALSDSQAWSAPTMLVSILCLWDLNRGRTVLYSFIMS